MLGSTFRVLNLDDDGVVAVTEMFCNIQCIVSLWDTGSQNKFVAAAGDGDGADTRAVVHSVLVDGCIIETQDGLAALRDSDFTAGHQVGQLRLISDTAGTAATTAAAFDQNAVAEQHAVLCGDIHILCLFVLIQRQIRHADIIRNDLVLYRVGRVLVKSVVYFGFYCSNNWIADNCHWFNSPP